MLKNTVLMVSQVNSYIKLMFEGDKNLENIFVCGEISNLKSNYSSGHTYFSLKENGAVIRAVMFSDSFRHLKFNPEDGMNVIARGSVSSYEKTGQYQIYVNDLQAYGSGIGYSETEEIKEKLEKEGLFSKQRKRVMPRYPSKIGVITSPSGAVIHDIESVVRRRYPACRIEVFPVQVQGENARNKIIEALKYFAGTQEKTDIIIIARGGGSAEDLSVFNDELVARKVAESTVPTVSAIGHDEDWSVCDFVSDVRASTPSVAAELVVPDKDQIIDLLLQFGHRINSEIKRIIQERRVYIENRSKYFCKGLPKICIDPRLGLIKILERKLLSFMSRSLSTQKLLVNTLDSKLEGVNPLNILNRGYAIVTSDKKKIARSIDLKEGYELEISFVDGTSRFEVKNLRRESFGE